MARLKPGLSKWKTPKVNHGIPPLILERTGFLLNKAAQRIREDTEEVLRPYGLTGRHVAVLVVISEKGSLPQLEIGKCISIDRTTMVQVVDDLERLKLVERRVNPSDRRAHGLFLTSKGCEILPRCLELGIEVEGKYLSCLSPKDQRELARILKHLVLTHYFRYPKLPE